MSFSYLDCQEKLEQSHAGGTIDGPQLPNVSMNSVKEVIVAPAPRMHDRDISLPWVVTELADKGARMATSGFVKLGRIEQI
jgi:hypothetical protein